MAPTPVVRFTTGETRSSVLQGFTLQNGSAGFEGGGIMVSFASPTIRENEIVDNAACIGIGISVNFGSPRIEGNRIANNVRTLCIGGSGGGIQVGGESATEIVGNVIEDNAINAGSDGGGISLFAAGTPTISANVIRGNVSQAEGGGIWIVNHSDALITDNLIVDNTSGVGGGIYWGVPFGERGPLLVNNTIAGNHAGAGSGIYSDGFQENVGLFNNIVIASPDETAITCDGLRDPLPPLFAANDVLAPDGSPYDGICPDVTGMDGNLSVDPAFFDAPHGDYHLLPGSPCVDAGDDVAPGLPAVDFDGAPRVQDGNDDGMAVVDIASRSYLLATLGAARPCPPRRSSAGSTRWESRSRRRTSHPRFERCSRHGSSA